MKTLFGMLMMVLVCLIASCGGGNSSTTIDTGSEFKFKSADLDTVQGRWFATSYVLDGTELMPVTASKIQIDIDSDGEWTVQVETKDSSNNSITEVADSKNPVNADIEVLTFSYVINEEGSITITENVKFKSTGNEHKISTTVIKDSIPANFVGSYYLESLILNGEVADLSNFSDILTIDSDGTFTSTGSEIDGSNESVTIGKGAIQDSHIFIDFTTVGNLVGTATLTGDTLSYSAKNESDNTTIATLKKITGGELVGSYILKGYSYSDSNGKVVSTTASNTVASGVMSFDSDGNRPVSYQVFEDGISVVNVVSDNQKYTIDGDKLTTIETSGNLEHSLSWAGTELKITYVLTDGAATIEESRTWQKVSD